MSEHDSHQQLTLLPSSDVPVQFRLDADTRRRGRAHVAEIRRHLAERQAAKAEVRTIPARPPVRPNAA
jgi:RNA 3'-terminal phosphate cyclase